ncbi:hypothetical protein [Phyllobacterium phragmitis]|uniref:Uncharacterized protein n=1 Tax=Phyllobacterium phragmitis TaxID=2670329 RepID=A0ABQ0H1Q6_9HYPH
MTTPTIRSPSAVDLTDLVVIGILMIVIVTNPLNPFSSEKPASSIAPMTDADLRA